MRQAIAFLLFLFITIGYTGAQTLSELQKERKKTEESIALTNRLLKENSKNKNQELSNLKLLSSKINYRKKLISNIKKETTELNNIIESKTLIIDSYQFDLEKQKEDYSKLIQHMWSNRSTYQQWMFILAGQDVGQVYRRFRYLNEYSTHQKTQAKSIQELTQRLSSERDSLEIQKTERASLMSKYNKEASTLKSEKQNKDKQIKSLDSKSKKLSQELAKQQKKYNELGRFVDELIAKEASKVKKDASGKMALTPEQKLTSKQFAGNKGKLPWPVASGVLDESYGVHAHDVYKSIKLEKNGVNIRADKGSDARCVFEGTVTSVMALPGFNKGIIVRHGEYLTMYANLSEVYVKSGDKVSTKQKLGKIFTDAEGKTIITFQVYKEMVKQNPQLWLSK